MNRKQKIIVSVTGIFIVLLALVGLTYGFFLTRIRGNDNPNSVILTTANLELTYDDKSNIIELNNMMPDTTRTKTFSVTNNGNETVTYDVYLEKVINELERTQDLTYTLTCSSFNDKTNESSGECNGKTNTTYPTKDGVVVTNV